MHWAAVAGGSGAGPSHRVITFESLASLFRRTWALAGMYPAGMYPVWRRSVFIRSAGSGGQGWADL